MKTTVSFPVWEVILFGFRLAKVEVLKLPNG